MTEFTNLITIAEMTPGPIAVNSATFVGIRIAGLPGALRQPGSVFSHLVSLYRYWHTYIGVTVGGSAMGSILGRSSPSGSGADRQVPDFRWLLAAVLPEVNGERMIQWGSLVLFFGSFYSAP